MLTFNYITGEWMRRAPEKGAEGDATGGPAGEEASSESESEFGDMAESFESDSYDDEAEEGEEEAEVEPEKEAASADDEQDVVEDEGEAEEDLEADESEGKEEEEAEPEEDDDAEEEQPQLTAEEVETARNQYIENMAEQFSISDEEADLLRTEPEKVLPKMFARVATQALEQAVNVMRHNLPKLVDGQLTQQSQAKETETKFFGKYPELKSKAAVKIAEGVAKAYRNANPDASTDELMDSVAFMTWKKLGLPMEKLSERMNGAEDEVFNATGKAPGKQGAYAPAKAGKTATERSKPASGQPSSEFEEIAHLLDNDSIFDTD